MFRCWGFMSMAMSTHTYPCRSAGAHSRTWQSTGTRIPKTPKIRTIRIRPPTSVEAKRRTLYDVVIVRYQEPSEPQRSEQVKPKQQDAGSSRPTAIHSSPRALPKLSHHMIHVEIDKEIENTQSLLSCPLAEAATNNTLLEVQPLVRLTALECRDRAR